MTLKALLVEDDIQLNTTISDYLSSTFDVVSLYDGQKAIGSVDESDFDLYIIDINIPNIDGLEVVKYIRQKDINFPIIMITASLELENFKTAFENGCNEYIKKPFFLEELEIRINNLLQNRQNIINIADNIQYDLEYEELKIDDKIISLRKKERRLLNILLQNINKIVKTDIICNYVWENEIKESYPLRQLINDVRKKFNINYIFAKSGVGYSFNISKN